MRDFYQIMHLKLDSTRDKTRLHNFNWKKQFKIEFVEFALNHLHFFKFYFTLSLDERVKYVHPKEVGHRKG